MVGRDADVLELHRQRRYEWQGSDELTEIADSLLGTTTFGYDGFGALSEARYADGTRELRAPDAVGNLFRTAERTDRRYGAGGQLREANGTRYQYDAEGNLICKTLPGGQQWHYAWDGGGQLVSVKRPDGYAVTFTYDALGRRISKRFRGRVTRWVWDGDKPLHEWSELEVGPEAGSVADLTTWLFEAGSFAPAAKLTAAGAQSVVCDHLGTPLELYDGQGVKTWQAQLDSYGAVRQGQGKAQDCPFRYQGQYEDVETGLYYNRFRYYDPGAGQYISQDPIRLWSGEFNLYAYVVAPTTWVDPLGLAGNCPLTGNEWKFNPEKDVDWRGISEHTDKTYREALDEAFRRTGVPKEEFTVKADKWGRDANGKSMPTQWDGPNGAQVNVDIPEWNGVIKDGKILSKGPHQPHIGYQTPKPRVRGHIFVDKIPVTRPPLPK